MNYRDYQRNVENVLNIITEQNRRNYFPRRNYTQANTFDVGHNIAYFLYNPARRANINRMNTSVPLGMGLSEDMIRLSTRIIPFTANFSDTRCPITLEDFAIDENVMQIIPCGHIFKTDALQNWFSRNTLCPCCRFDVRNFIINGIVNESRNISRHNSIDIPQPAISSETEIAVDVEVEMTI
jgi:hypothetical protein